MSNTQRTLIQLSRKGIHDASNEPTNGLEGARSTEIRRFKPPVSTKIPRDFDRHG